VVLNLSHVPDATNRPDLAEAQAMTVRASMTFRPDGA
jgi:hypothetical protein